MDSGVPRKARPIKVLLVTTNCLPCPFIKTNKQPLNWPRLTTSLTVNIDTHLAVVDKNREDRLDFGRRNGTHPSLRRRLGP
jgi:hypothetical protein